MKILKFFFFLFFIFLIFNFYLKNPRKVLNEDIYISPQPNSKKINFLIKKFKIKSVINLRGENKGQEWYEEEKRVLEKKGILFFNLKLSKDKDFPRKEALKVLNIFPKIKYPLLIHCKDGYDRSYFFAKLLLKMKGKDINERYYAKTKIFSFYKNYKNFLKEKNLEDNSYNLKNFIEYEYIPENFKYEIKTEEVPDFIKKGETLTFKFKVINQSKKIWVMKSDLKKGIRFGAKIFGPFKDFPEDLESYFYKNEGKGIDIARAGIEDGKIKIGDSKTFKLSFKAPEEKGFYFLIFDMVDENLNWFYYYGKSPFFYTFKIP